MERQPLHSLIINYAVLSAIENEGLLPLLFKYALKADGNLMALLKKHDKNEFDEFDLRLLAIAGIAGKIPDDGIRQYCASLLIALLNISGPDDKTVKAVADLLFNLERIELIKEFRAVLAEGEDQMSKRMIDSVAEYISESLIKHLLELKDASDQTIIEHANTLDDLDFGASLITDFMTERAEEISDDGIARLENLRTRMLEMSGASATT